jgi:hypothetical protein
MVRSITSVNCFVSKKQPFLPQEGRRVWPANRDEMRVILGQRGRQRGGGGIRLFRLARVDHCHQQVAELGKALLSSSACCRHGRLLENIRSVSVVTSRCVTA